MAWNQSFVAIFRYTVLEILVYKPWLEFIAKVCINKL